MHETLAQVTIMEKKEQKERKDLIWKGFPLKEKKK